MSDFFRKIFQLTGKLLGKLRAAFARYVAESWFWITSLSIIAIVVGVLGGAFAAGAMLFLGVSKIGLGALGLMGFCS